MLVFFSVVIIISVSRRSLTLNMDTINRIYNTRKTTLFCDESLMSPCLEGSLAKAACNHDSLCCNMLDLL